MTRQTSHTPLIDGSKSCRHCGETKPLTAFPPLRTMRDGRGSWCRPCANRASVLSKLPATLERDRQYRLARYLAMRPVYELVCATCGVTFTTGKSLQRFCNPDCRQTWRKRKAAVGPNARAKAQIKDRDGWRCYLCGLAVKPALVWPHPLAGSIDHVVPVSRGGRGTLTNLHLAHWACNLDKGDNDAPWWIAV